MKHCISFLWLVLIWLLGFSPAPLLARTDAMEIASAWNRPVPQVPARMQVANMQLDLDAQARREIQADVDALYRNENYLQIKLSRIRTYFPLVEAELRAAGMPDDLKYLVVQESSLIADAVSSSNAVGYWQFKQGTAEEVFLRVDRQIDERKNIVSSTQGAARYLAKNMATFDNWMVAIVAYQMGPGGAKNYFGNQFSGQRNVKIDRKTHWYFKKFLAHKVAFEGYQDGFVSQAETLQAVPLRGPTHLKSLAAEWSVPLDRLEAYNKWTRDGQIPGDKMYTVIVPGAREIRPPVLAESRPQATQAPADPTLLAGNVPIRLSYFNKRTRAVPQQGTSQSAMAAQLGMREGKFRRLNDLEKGAPIEAGVNYFTQRKRGRAEEAETHVVRAGESLWHVAQRYGIRLQRLEYLNRIKENEIRPGMVLNLRKRRGKNQALRIQNVPAESRQAAPAQQGPASRPAPGAQTPTKMEPPASGRATHTVQQGDTLFGISRQYGISVDALKSWNGIGADNVIRPGQRLFVSAP